MNCACVLVHILLNVFFNISVSSSLIIAAPYSWAGWLQAACTVKGNVRASAVLWGYRAACGCIML